MKILSFTLLAVLSTMAAAEPQARLKAHIGQNGGGTLDQPSLSWSGTALKIFAVTSMTATVQVDSKSPGITVGDGTVTLCYHQKIITPPPGEMVPHWARPVLLEFTVMGLPKRDYKVSVSVC